jgi:hypothetical protein
MGLRIYLMCLCCVSCAHATAQVAVGCQENPTLQAQRSAELLRLAEEDQADRAGPYETLDFTRINPRDLQRRTRVAAIFAEGCFAQASDYASAAIIYQHGTVADHYYQTFIWAGKAVKLGDVSQRWLMAAALDRYLVAIGQKQLFGTQLSKNDGGAWCVQPVEPSFPEATRVEYVRFSVKQQIANTLRAIGINGYPDQVVDCTPALKPTLRGTVPGFW